MHHAVEDVRPLLEEEEEVEVAMMIHRHHTTMGPLQGSHEAVIPQPEGVERGKSNGDQASGPGRSVERRLVTWPVREINPANKKLNRGVEDFSVVEREIHEAAAGLEAAVMLERAVRGHTVLAHQLRLQAGTRAQGSAAQQGGKSTISFWSG